MLDLKRFGLVAPVRYRKPHRVFILLKTRSVPTGPHPRLKAKQAIRDLLINSKLKNGSRKNS